MSKFSAGDVCWAGDTTDANQQRPISILAHDTHPFSATDCTVMCVGTTAGEYQQTTPELEAEHLDGISFSDTSYLKPCALYTIPPGTIQNGRMKGELTDAGSTLLKKSLISLLP